MLEAMTFTGNKYLIPCVWAAAVVERARKENKIKDDLAVQKLINVGMFTFVHFGFLIIIMRRFKNVQMKKSWKLCNATGTSRLHGTLLKTVTVALAYSSSRFALTDSFCLSAWPNG